MHPGSGTALRRLERTLSVNRHLVEKLAMPLVYRRTWPRLRATIATLRDAEGRSARETLVRNEIHALEAARAAGVHSPFFRDLYDGHGAIQTIEDFRRLPVMTKSHLREHCDRIVRDDADRADLVKGATGGSTGEPTPYFHDTAWWLRASAAALRGDEWTGWRIGERHANLWGTPLHESRSAKLLRTVGERARNQLFVPSFDLSRDVIDRNIDRLVAWKPRLVTGYASVLAAYAHRIVERGVEMPAPRAIVSSAETLHPPVRDLVERAFRAPVFDRYGCRELGMIAQECAVHEGLHVATEHVFVEVETDGRPARPGETGRLLITLIPPASFPFVRYEVGDAAVVSDGEPCLCGLPYPRLARIEGRLVDVLRRADGSAFTGLFFPHLMKEFPWVREFQVVQDERGDVEIRVVVKERAPGEDARTAVVAEAVAAMGPGLHITLAIVPALEKTASGKVRVTQSRFRPAARTAAGVSR